MMKSKYGIIDQPVGEIKPYQEWYGAIDLQAAGPPDRPNLCLSRMGLGPVSIWILSRAFGSPSWTTWEAAFSGGQQAKALTPPSRPTPT